MRVGASSAGRTRLPAPLEAMQVRFKGEGPMQQMYQHGVIGPVLTLVAWTFVMWLWMYATRIPAMQKAKIDPQEAANAGRLDLPPEVTRVADNYNHLHEQPTIFYALALSAQIAGVTDPVNIGLAWAYVAVRVVHSLIQATGNIIVLRFSAFTIGTLVLLTLLVRTVAHILGVGFW
jgi:hypothetical protein